MINFVDTASITWSVDSSGNLTANATNIPGGGKQTVGSVAGIVTVDVSLGSSIFINVTEAITDIVLNSPVDGQEITIIFAEDSTGGWAVTLGANMLGAPTISTGANTHSCYKWSYNSPDTNWYLIGASGM